MRSFGIRFLITLLTVCLCFPVFSVNADNEAVSICLSVEGEAYKGGELTLRVAVSKPTTALAGLEFTLAYDSNYVGANIVQIDGEALQTDAFVASMPNGWEQISSHKEGLYTFRFAMPVNGKDLLDNENELVLEIPFTVRAAGSFDFTVASEDIVSVVNDKENTTLSGNGDKLSVVASSEAQKIGIEFKGSDTANEKGKYELVIEALNLGDTSGIAALEFEFTYDKSVFSPTVTTNTNDEMNAFMKDMPGDWEQMCSFDSVKGRYTLRFAAKNAELLADADVLKTGEKMVISVPFEVIGGEGDIASFMVEASSVIGINCVNGILSGSGSIKSVSVEKAPAGTIPDGLGYIVKDGFLMYIDEKTSVSDFLAPFDSVFSVNSSGDIICTGDILTDGNALTLKLIVCGDVNGSGDIEKYDYILVKRSCMGTFSFNDSQLLAADTNRNGSVDKYDYILAKRHCMGTFTIKADEQ